MRRRTIIWRRPAVWVLTVWVLGCHAEDPAAPTSNATVRIALTATECADWCIATIGAELYREGEVLPLGPPRLAACGEPLLFDELPAGTRVRVRAWMDQGLARRLQGWSEVVTVAQDTVVTPTVQLEAVEPPVATSVSPEPLVPGIDAEVEITGASFGSGEGYSQVEVGGTALSVLEWGPGNVRATVSEVLSGLELTVRSCGVSSAPVPTRVVRESLAVARRDLPGCDGLAIEHATATADAVWLTGGCTNGTGDVVRLQLGTCALDAFSASVPSAPVASAAVAESLLVATADDIHVVGADGTVSAIGWQGPGMISSLAADASGVVVVAGNAPALYRGDTSGAPVLGLPESWSPVRVALSADRIVVAAEGQQSAGLVALSRSGIAPPTEWPIEGCGSVQALATAPRYWAVACGGQPSVVAVLDSDSGLTRSVQPATAPTGLAFDTRGDVLLATRNDTLSAWHLPSSGAARHLRHWAISGHRVSPIGGDTFALVSALPEVVLVSPYAGTALCGEAL